MNRQPGALVVAVALLVIVAATVVAYYPAMSAGFYFDDVPNFSGAPAMHWTELSLEALDRTLSEAWSKSRPVANVSFALTHYVSGLDPAPYHWSNLGIHLAVGFAIFWVIRKLQAQLDIQQSGIWWALIAVFLFLVHPLNIQAVTYVVQRMTSLATLFSLLAFGSYLAARHHKNISRRYIWFTISGAFFLFGIGSKEVSYLLLPTLLLYEICFHRIEWLQWLRSGIKPVRRKTLIVFSAIITIALISAAWYIAASSFYWTDVMPKRDYSGFERVLTQGRVQFFYLSLLLWPSPSRLNLDHDFVVSRSLLDPASTIIALIAWLLIIAFALRNIPSRPRLAFPILGYILLHSMESGPINLELVFEHRMYFPNTMLALLIGLNPPALKKTYLAAGLSVIAGAGLILATVTYNRNLVWADPIAFLEDTARKSPGKFRPQYNLGTELGKMGLIAEAKVALQRAAELEPENPQAHNQLGNVYMYEKRYDVAEQHYLLAIKYDPTYPQALYNLSRILARQKRYDEQIEVLRQFIEHAPPYLDRQKQAAILELNKLSND